MIDGSPGPSVIPELPKLQPGKFFQLWEYRVSHRQLLIRCPRTNDSESNVDIMFFNVHYMALPTTFRDPKFVVPTNEDVASVRERVGAIPDKQMVFAVECGEHRHIIVAGAVKVCTSEMEAFRSPFELPPVVTS